MQDASGRSASAAAASASQRPDHLVLLRGADMEAWESESPMAAVTLPSRPPRLTGATPSSTNGLPLPPRTTRPRPPPARPPTLSRTVSLPPAVPPRPESTLTSASRRLSRPTTPAATAAVAASAVASEASAFVSLPPVQARIPTSPVMIDPSDISLASPRPEPDRVQNLYVEAPLTGGGPSSQQSSRWFRTSSSSSSGSSKGGSLSSSSHHHQKKSLASVHSGRNRSKSNSKPSTNNSCDSKPGAATAAAVPTVSPPPAPTPTPVPPQLPPKQVDSIICIECGKCRCNACQAPKRLPEKWLFGGSVKCSKDSVVDCLSCMCVVKGALYHCGKDCEDSGADDLGDSNPCSCTGSHAAARWACMGLMSLIMPCLWCYLPLRGCAMATQAVYERCNASGCQCPNRPSASAAAAVSAASSSPVISSEPASTSSLMASSAKSDTTSVLSSPVDPKQRLLSE